MGTVQHIGNGVATLSGLPRSRTDELVTFPTGVQGLILNLEHDHVDVILLGPEEGIQGGDQVVATGERLRVPVGHTLLGRIVNPLGQPSGRPRTGRKCIALVFGARCAGHCRARACQ